MKIPEELKPLLETLKTERIPTFFVGGCVRDHVMGIPAKDYDLELLDVEEESLLKLLTRHGTYKKVGDSFGVIKFRPNPTSGDLFEVDISIATSENLGDFLSLESVASRRDFTMNSLYVNAHTGKLSDPRGGLLDIYNKELRHNYRGNTSSIEADPIRVLRAMQFSSRFGFVVSPGTMETMTKTKDRYASIKPERVWAEFKKWSVGKYPMLGLEILEYSLWIKNFPELDSLQDIEQNPEYHPEGDAWIHTCLATQAAADIAARERLSCLETSYLVMAALCHDLGKVSTTTLNKKGQISSPGHDKVGARLAEKFLAGIGANPLFAETVSSLVSEHMFHVCSDITPKSVRRLSARLRGDATIRLLSLLIEADHAARPPLPTEHPCPELMEIASSLDVTSSPPEQILKGRHLIELGIKPGAIMGYFLSVAYEAQLRGEFGTEPEAITWFKSHQDKYEEGK